MKNASAQLNIVFIIHLGILGLIIAGLIPREAVLALFGVLVYFFLFAPREDALMYFARSIPFFVALPISETFDSLDMGRVLAIILFLRVALPYVRSDTARELIRNIQSREFRDAHRLEILGVLVLLLAAISIVAAMDSGVAIKRLIYVGNAVILYPVVLAVIKDRDMFSRMMKHVVVGMLFVSAIGYLQLWTTYLWDFMRFSGFWALNVQYNFYGTAWSSIVYHSNTWFAYLGGEGLRLRVFSTFPDSHSFPMYLIMGLASFVTLASRQFLMKGLFRHILAFFKNKKEIIQKKIVVIILVLILLITILSGTRGIWVSAVFPILAIGAYLARFRSPGTIVKLSAVIFLVFLVLIPVASYIFSIPQFGAGAPGENLETEAFLKRFTSSFDPTETSNQGRLFIWKRTLVSVLRSPLFGVGIGNFPIILDQDVILAKAGSSAHNLYLQIASEMGLVALVIFLLILLELAKSAWRTFQHAKTDDLRVFGWMGLLSLFWVAGYSLTDAALFDGRVMAMFVIFAGMIRKAQQVEK